MTGYQTSVAFDILMFIIPEPILIDCLLHCDERRRMCISAKIRTDAAVIDICED